MQLDAAYDIYSWFHVLLDLRYVEGVYRGVLPYNIS